MRYAVALLLIGLMCFGCATAPEKGKNSDQLDTFRGVDYPSAAEAEKAFSAFRVSCVGADCTPSVGVLVRRKLIFVSACTASVVDSKHILTARHCVYGDESGEFRGGDLGAEYAFVWRQENGANQRVKASRVVAFSSESLVKTVANRDYAVLELERDIDSPPVSLSFHGVDEQSVTVRGMQINILTAEAVLSSRSCRSVMRSLFLPQYQNSQNPVILLSDCKTRGGWSGAPVYNRNGEVIAVVSAKQDAVRSQELSAALSRRSTPNKYFALATNMACVDWKRDIAQWPPECSQNLSENESEANRTIVGNIDFAVEKTLRTKHPRVWAAATQGPVRGAIFGPQVQTVTGQTAIRWLPNCVLSGSRMPASVSQWSGSFESGWTADLVYEPQFRDLKENTWKPAGQKGARYLFTEQGSQETVSVPTCH